MSTAPKRRILAGDVVSDKMEKTIVVRIVRRKVHRLYKKYVTVSRRLKAHDPNNDCRIGDSVRIVESRPLSRDKHWRLLEIVQRAD
jgi:small subunit ribosomal protein S17